LKFDQKLDAFRDPIDREYYPRQAWHDVHCSCEGEAVQDICTNFIERWNHHTRAQDTNNRLVVKMPNSFFQAQQGENLWKRMRSHFGAERKERKERERTERKEKRDKRKHKVDKKENRTPMEMWNDLSTKIHRQFEPQTIFSAHKGPKSTQEGEGHTRSKTIDESKLYAASELPQVNPEKISTKMLNGFKTLRMGRGKHKDEDDNSDEMNNPALSHRSNLSAIFGDKRSLSGDVDQQNKGAFRRNSADSPVSAVETDFHKYSASIADGGRRRGSLISPRSARTQSLIRNDKMEGILNAEAERKSKARDKWYKQGQEEGFTCDVQVVRSISKWSGSTATEQSIYAAYVDLITKAKHFIYIENQYFIGSTAGGQVRNVVAQMILNRLITAITNQETFRVIIIVPVLPDGDPSDASIQQVIKWQYRTIINSKGSILNTLRETFPKANLEDYISFYCLRSHGMLNNEFYIHEHDEQVEAHEQREKSKGKTNLNGLADIKTSGDKDENEDDEAENRNAMNVKTQKRIFTDTGKRVVTEQIYVHSKLMIVDDRVCVIGSANINDRSMLGNRDSEICAIIEDKDFVWSKMNGQSYRAGKFALSLRLRLWKEHLGLLKKKHSSWENDPTEFEEVSGHTMNDPSVYKLDKEMNASKRRQIKKALLDPIVDSTYKIWIDTAKANTAIYESVFPNIVSNKYPTVEAYLEERDRYNPLIEIEKKRREELERERWKNYRDMKKQEGSSAEINLLCETPCEEKEERISTESKMPDDQILNTYGQSVERKISSADFRKEQLLKRIELSKLRGNLCMYPLEFAKYDTFKKTLSLNLVDDSIFT
jgi:phospholipase D1/2